MNQRTGLMSAAAIVCVVVSLAIAAERTTAEPAASRRAATTVQRWQIHTAEFLYSSEGEEHSSTNTILLDAETGDTWMMWPSGDGDVYGWTKMPRK